MNKITITLLSVLLLAWPAILPAAETKVARPNILLFFVDDWGRDASIYADARRPSPSDVVRTPNTDRIGREGVVFNNAFVQVSSCTPSRASLATGRYFWSCGSHAFLNEKASDWTGIQNPFETLPKFPDLLRESGYLSCKSLKTIAFTESKLTAPTREVAKVPYQRYGLYVSAAKTDTERQKRIAETLNHPRMEMRRVLKAREAGQPFFFIYGTINVHRPYAPGSGEKLWGIDPEKLKGRLPKFLPDVPDVRRDFADYLGEVQAADAMLGVMIEELEAAGELDNTVVILTGDNGIPGIPRGKTGCYDLSVRAPLLVRWPKGISAGRRVEDFVSVMDIGPTLLELAGLPRVAEMDGRSFLKQLRSDQSGWIDAARNSVIVGRELHFESARDGNLPYPMRAIRTPDFLYIRNFKPDRWPVGAPYNLENLKTTADYEQHDDGPYRDLDSSLTKTWLLSHRDDSQARETIKLTLEKRAGEELYDLRNDPDQLHNLAAEPARVETKKELSNRLMAVLAQTKDPRLTGAFDKPPYVSATGLVKKKRKKEP